MSSIAYYVYLYDGFTESAEAYPTRGPSIPDVSASLPRNRLHVLAKDTVVPGLSISEISPDNEKITAVAE